MDFNPVRNIKLGGYLGVFHLNELSIGGGRKCANASIHRIVADSKLWWVVPLEQTE